MHAFGTRRGRGMVIPDNPLGLEGEKNRGLKSSLEL